MRQRWLDRRQLGWRRRWRKRRLRRRQLVVDVIIVVKFFSKFRRLSRSSSQRHELEWSRWETRTMLKNVKTKKKNPSKIVSFISVSKTTCNAIDLTGKTKTRFTLLIPQVNLNFFWEKELDLAICLIQKHCQKNASMRSQSNSFVKLMVWAFWVPSFLTQVVKSEDRNRTLTTAKEMPFQVKQLSFLICDRLKASVVNAKKIMNAIKKIPLQWKANLVLGCWTHACQISNRKSILLKCFITILWSFTNKILNGKLIWNSLIQ